MIIGPDSHFQDFISCLIFAFIGDTIDHIIYSKQSINVLLSFSINLIQKNNS